MPFQLRPRRGRQRRESRLPDREHEGRLCSQRLGPVGAIRVLGLIGCEMFSSSSTGKSWFRFAQLDWNRIKHRIKKDPCEAAIAVAVEVRAGFDHVGGI
jgi:hypothetical protein